MTKLRLIHWPHNFYLPTLLFLCETLFFLCILSAGHHIQCVPQKTLISQADIQNITCGHFHSVTIQSCNVIQIDHIRFVNSIKRSVIQITADRFQIKCQRDRAFALCLHNYFGVTAIRLQISNILEIKYLVIVPDFERDFRFLFSYSFYFNISSI